MEQNDLPLEEATAEPLRREDRLLTAMLEGYVAHHGCAPIGNSLVDLMDAAASFEANLARRDQRQSQQRHQKKMEEWRKAVEEDLAEMEEDG